MPAAEMAVTDGSGVRAVPADALEAFVEQHYRRLVRLAGLVCLDRADAQDAVQNALERAWRHRTSVRDETKTRAWLDSIVVRESIRINRAPAAILRALARPLRPGEDAVAPRPRVDVAFLEDLRRLSPAQRAVLALHIEGGYSLAETALLVNAPLETVRSRLRLARQRLRRELSNESEGLR